MKTPFTKQDRADLKQLTELVERKRREVTRTEEDTTGKHSKS